MEIKTFILGELQTNCYIVIDQNTNHCLIIDPADDANFISEQILRLKLKPTAIIATHGHFDHILASYELQLAFSLPAVAPPLARAKEGPRLPFYIHPKDFFLVKNLQKNASFWTKRKIIESPPNNIVILSPSEESTLASQGLPLRSWQARVIETPGHTPGSVCLYFPKEKVLFTGDTLFADGVGRTDLSYSSPSDLQNSLKKLSKLPPETKIYPGHGDESTLHAEKTSLHYFSNLLV